MPIASAGRPAEARFGSDDVDDLHVVPPPVAPSVVPDPFVERERVTRWIALEGLDVAAIERWVASGSGVFLREDATWTVSWNGIVVRVRDAKGLRYLARLLARPDEAVHVLELVRDGGAAGSPAASAAEVERARSTVAQRIRGALQRLGEQHRALAEHLRLHVRTGARCVYRADPIRPVRWIV